MQGKKKVFMAISGWLAISTTASACPLCLLGMYEAHIANLSNWLMNFLPLWAPMLTGVVLYGKALCKRLYRLTHRS